MPFKLLANTLWLTGFLGIAVPAAVQAADSTTLPVLLGSESFTASIEGAGAVGPDVPNALPESNRLVSSRLDSLLEGVPDASRSESDVPAAADAPAEDTNAPSLPALAEPVEPVPAEALPALPTVQESPEVEFIDGTTQGNPNPAVSAPTQIPSLPPQTTPRYEDALIAPNTPVTPGALQPAFDNYHLGPGDSIFVSVQRYPDLSFQATLDLQGNIVVPLQGAVPFEGLTLAEAEDRLRLVYNQYVVIREPRDVTLTLVAQRGVEVTILGSVQRPGFYPLTDPSVATALLIAGGATRTSDLRAIQVQRQLRRNGQVFEETVNVDLFTPLKEGSPLPDVRLEDGDVVIIPELDPSQLDEYDRGLVARSTLAQPIINVRFLNYSGGRSRIGTINLNNGSTFLDGISLLGVSPDTANLGDVALIRYDPETGRAVTVSLDAKSAIQGDITQDPLLEDSDVIVVGRNLVGRLSFALQTVTRPFRDVLGFTRFFDNFLNDSNFFNP
ncbi:MAG: polysaccharide biosynthesis/export family protein [Cyanobacteria bacterium J06598_3]